MRHMITLQALTILPAFAVHMALAAGATPPPVDHDAILRERVNRLIPEAMKSQGVNLWLTFTRENATDPLLVTLGLEHIVARGAFIFILNQDGSFKKVAIAA